MSSKPPSLLAAEKLESSGLNAEHGKLMKLKAMTAAQTESLRKSCNATWPAVAALLIPYFDFDGRVTKFWRMRYLEDPRPAGFAQAVEGKVLRYVQAPNTVNEAYYPPVFDVPWRDFTKVTEQEIVITEGELKAAAMCVAGFPCIGLGGVFNYGVPKKGIALLPSLAEFDWRDRRVTILFDSDAATNENVMLATLRLARELTTKQAQVYIAKLLPDGDKKVGADDFLVANGDRAMARVLAEAEPFEEGAALHTLNTEVVFVRNPGLVVEIQSKQRMSVQQFVTANYANRKFVRITPRPRSAAIVENRSAASDWIKWAGRREVREMSYEPGQSMFYNNTFNLWPGWGVEPKKGDVKPWKTLLDYMMQDEGPAARKWIEQWFAYPLQHPGTKMFSAVVNFSVQTGTGKSLLGKTMVKIYGKNGNTIKEGDFESAFNNWAVNKQFIMGEEITSGERRKSVIADLLKALITQDVVEINQKFVPQYSVRDCINYYFNTNHPDAFFLEDTDRRYFINEIKQKPLDMSFYRDYATKLAEGGLAEAIFYHLLNLDLTGFNPAAPAMDTKAKQRMMGLGRTDLGNWVRELRDNPDAVLKFREEARGKDLFTNEQIVMMFDPLNTARIGPNVLARELRRAGIPLAANGSQVVMPTGSYKRLNVLRNYDKWVNARPSECEAHLTGPNTKKPSKKY